MKFASVVANLFQYTAASAKNVENADLSLSHQLRFVF